MDTSGVPPALFDEVARICLGLPEVTLRSDRLAHAFQIRRRIFTFLLAPEDQAGVPVPMIVVRADPLERRALLEVGHPFFAPGGGADRIGVVLGDTTDWEELAELVTESYRILAPKKLVRLLDVAPPGA